MSQRLAIFASGRGSNAKALLESGAAGRIDAEFALVLSNRADAGVLGIAADFRVPTEVVERAGRNRAEHEREILAKLAEHRIDHVLLAGYMRVLSPVFLNGFSGAVLNIHPSLLPEFRGLHAQKQALEAGRTRVGATVHFVTEGVDEGPIILQRAIELRGDESLEEVEARILTEVEHQIYPEAVAMFLRGEADGAPLATQKVTSAS